MSHIDIAIESNNRQKIAEIIEVFLASEIVLNLKIRNYHWNVESKNFSELHSFFEELYDNSSESIDDLAERMRMLGFQVNANHENFLDKSFLNSELKDSKPADQMISSLLDDKHTTITQMRDAITKISDLGDVGTEDFLTGLIQAHEKNAWMLRSMLVK